MQAIAQRHRSTQVDADFHAGAHALVCVIELSDLCFGIPLAELQEVLICIINFSQALNLIIDGFVVLTHT